MRFQGKANKTLNRVCKSDIKVVLKSLKAPERKERP